MENINSYNEFLANNRDNQLILHLVLEESNVHPIVSKPCILFIKNIKLDKIYHISFSHPDSSIFLTKEQVMKDIDALLPNTKWVLDKKSFIQLFNIKNCADINLLGFLKNNKILDYTEFETSAHNLIKRNCGGRYNNIINKIIPLVKHKEAFTEMCECAERLIKSIESFEVFDRINNEIIPLLSDIEKNGIFVDADIFRKFFGNTAKIYDVNLVYSIYHLYTTTGRPSNHYDNVNYAALKKDDGSRNAFISRYGTDGKMVLIDYSAFHPRIICYLTGFNIPATTNIYEYLGQLYFNREEMDEKDIIEAKKITFRQLYGGVEDKYNTIKYFSNLKKYIDDKWMFFLNNGYVETPLLKRQITGKHIKDANPNKLFNYILQASELEFALPSLLALNQYLKDKKTKMILYTYDSVLFDFHNEESGILNEIIKIMTMNGKFPVKVYSGKSFGELKQMSFLQ